MALKPTLAALACATAGAAAWAGILISFEREMDVLAVAIGVAIGFVAAKVGARGSKQALSCGLLAVIAVLSGKLVGTQVMYGKAVDSGVASMVSQSMYNEDREAALEFADLPASEHAEFAGRWFYDEGESGLSAEQISSFKKYDAPRLQWITKTTPDYAAWASYRSDSMHKQLSAVSLVARFRLVTDTEDDMDLLFDLLFMLLAGLAAFQMVLRQGQAKATSHEQVYL